MDQDRSVSLGGTMLGVGADPVKAFARGRVCREPGCRTRLSMYNSGAYCARHDVGRVNEATQRGRKKVASARLA